MQEVGRSRRRVDSIDRDWTKGNVFHNLLAISWPIVVGNSLNLLGPVVDMIWVAKLGAAAIAGVGVAGMAVMMITSARMGLSMGSRAIIARAIGAGDSKDANHVIQQYFVISSIYSVVMALIGILLSKQIMSLFGLDADVIAEGTSYMRIQFIGTVAMSFRVMTETIMQASGDTQTPMRITVIFRIFHAALAPFLIFGWLFFPNLGVSGAALTNVISQGLGAIVGIWILSSGRTRLRLSMKNFSFDGPIIWRIIRVGFPAAIMNTERFFGDIVLMWFMSPFGTIAVAGHSLIQRIEAIMRMPSMGLGNAAAVLVGQNLGAKQPERAAKSGWLAVALAQGLAVIVCISILLWAEPIIRVFNSEPAVVAMTATFLRIGSAGYLFMGLYFVMQNAISGAGDTIPPMLISMLNFWIVQIPIAFFLSRKTGLGVNGVRWAIVIGWAVGAAAYAIYFWKGRWKRKQV
ncbi:MAG TPA: MATE family efflux transporter [Dehalococcoidales bacterium]|nr:MATE family efflux transporter [Dehalococcoidales bacterium]